MLNKTFPGGVDVWSFNPTPLQHNPYIKNLVKVTKEHTADAIDFYGDRIMHLSPARNMVCQHLYQAGNHMIDYLTNSTLGLSLRAHEKSLIVRWKPKAEKSIAKIFKKHKLESGKFTILHPVYGWPSRTLPEDYYRKIIDHAVAQGDRVVLVGQNVDPKTLTPADNSAKDVTDKEFKGTYDIPKSRDYVKLINGLSFQEACCLYQHARVVLNTENGNLVMSGTNDSPCWNLYIPSLTAPEFRLPWRNGDQYYRTKVVTNDENYFPGSDYLNLKKEAVDFINVPVKWPSVNKIIEAYETIPR